MSKFIKLVRKPVCGNRTYKILSIFKLQQKELFVKLGLIENKKHNKQVYLDVNKFLLHFLQGANVSRQLLNVAKRTNILKSPWY